MAAEITVAPGNIVEFADKGKYHLGLVTSVEAKSGKVRLIHSSGKDLTLPAKQILYRFERSISTTLPLSNIQNELKSLDARADAFAPECHIDEIYQVVVDDLGELSIEDALGLFFDQPDDGQRLAMLRAFRNDKIYFKNIQSGVYAPRPRQIVEDLKRQAEIKAQKDRWRQTFADEIIRLPQMSPTDREIALEQGAVASSDVADAFQIVEQYAILGADYPDKGEAETLIETVQNRLNRGFKGTAHIRARSLLRETGIWTNQTNVALLKYEIPTVFSDQVEKDALRIYDLPPVTQNRTNMTHLNVFSIDDDDTLDIDDALSIERLGDGTLRLGVHIAAPAAAISIGSPLETEARHRATSVYIPEMRIPMLPTILSENALSLMEGQKRASITFFMTFNSDFTQISSEIIPSYIRSGHRLTYDIAEHLIEDGNDVLSDEIRLIQEITEVSAANRRANGAIDIDLPEYKLTYSEADDTYHLKPIDPVMMSRLLVAECMILANHAAAEFCDMHDIPALYRIQPPPVSVPSQETLDSLPNDMMRAYALRRCMQPAASSMTPGPHAGLGLDKYLQATSPLRRYTDLIAHYQFESWFAGQKPRFDAEQFNAMLSETDLGLTHARSASAEAVYTATLRYLQQLGTDPIEAIIIQYVSDHSDVAQIALVQTQIRATVATKSRWPAGTFCTVKIDHINPDEGSILLQFIDIITP